MIRRRSLVAGAALSLLARPAFAILPVPRGNYLRFRIIREGQDIGLHALDFSPEPQRLLIQIAIDIHLALGPTPIFAYRQRAIETWLQDQFVGFHSRTEVNGRRLDAWVRRSGQGLAVDGNTVARYIAPETALPTTYWNRQLLDAAMIDSQSGRLLHPKVTYAGSDQIRLSPSETVAASHYVLSGDLRIELWYDPDDIWLGLAFHGSDGSLITYRRI